AFVSDHRYVEESIARPMIAVRLGVDDITEATEPLDLPFQPHSVARLMRRVDQHQPIRSRDDPVISTLQPGLNEYVGCQLFHDIPLIVPYSLCPSSRATCSAKRGSAISSNATLRSAKRPCDWMPLTMFSIPDRVGTPLPAQAKAIRSKVLTAISGFMFIVLTMNPTDRSLEPI